MKLAFSTLGCPDWSWDEIFATAKDMRIDGIEIRGVGKEMYAPHCKIFNRENAPATMERMAASGMEFSALTSGVTLGMPDSREKHEQEVIDYIELAARLHIPYIRVMISPRPEPEEINWEQAKALYVAWSKLAGEKGVCLLVETNGVLADSSKMSEFMEGVDPNSTGVLWDVHHPYRFFEESPYDTYEKIGKYVKYVHVKDSVMQNEKVAYRMMGYGDVPIFDSLKVLKEGGYDGFITLEWVKRWNQELQEPGIVFYHYANYMEYLVQQLES